MITAHKVLAAYACLAPRIVTGQFDPTRHRAIWPSTGNYARGGIAISRIMASRGVAILPEGMSQERFDWLERWCENPADDVIRTHGTESNVKEIYDACNELAQDPEQLRAQPVLRVRQPPRPLRDHRARAGARVRRGARGVGSRSAAGRVRVGHRVGRHDRRRRPAEGRVRHADRRRRGARVPDDARERLRRAQHPGHRRQAHPADPQRDEHRRRRARSATVRPTSSTCCSTPTAGRAYLADRKVVAADVIDALGHFGFSSTCNVLAAIKTAKLLDLGPDDAIITVATDGGAMYPSERAKTLAARFGGEFTAVDAAEVVRRAPRRRRRPSTRSSAPRPTAAGSSTSATTRGSSSRARRSTCSSSAAARSSGADCAATSACGTR